VSDERALIAFAIDAGMRLCGERGTFTAEELRQEMFDEGMIATLEPFQSWELEAIRRGPFTRKAGTANDYELAPWMHQ
jgi:hypothetical protein